MNNEIQKQNEKKMEVVKAVASIAQWAVLLGMQDGTLYLFLMYLGKQPITVESIDHTLQIMVNTVEGDVSQLEDEHAEYALKKGWLKGFESIQNMEVDQ